MAAETIVCEISGNSAIEIPCHTDDHFVWLRGTGLLKTREDGLDILDFWHLRGGDRIIITNRVSQLPDWFYLTPAETRGDALHELMKRGGSADMFGEKAQAMNVWRVEAGDALAWLGQPRKGFEARDGVLTLFEFKTNAVTLGEPIGQALDDWQFFGAPTSSTPDEFAVAAVRVAIQLLRRRLPQAVRVDEWAIESA